MSPEIRERFAERARIAYYDGCQSHEWAKLTDEDRECWRRVVDSLTPETQPEFNAALSHLRAVLDARLPHRDFNGADNCMTCSNDGFKYVLCCPFQAAQAFVDGLDGKLA